MSVDISQVPLFRSLSAKDQETVVGGFVTETYKDGQKIFKQGDLGDAFYIVVDGQANVMVRPSNFIKVSDEV